MVARGNHVVFTIACHMAFGGAEPLLFQQIAEKIDLVGAAAVEFTPIDGIQELVLPTRLMRV